MTVLWVEPGRCRWCGEWNYAGTFCSDLCEALHDQRMWERFPHLMQREEVSSG